MKESLQNVKLNFNVALKKFPTEGNLVYEYNPFYNYRLENDKFFYKNQFYTPEELAKELGYINEKEEGDWDALEQAIKEGASYDWYKVIPKTETQPILYQKGQLVDFVTDQLDFSLNNPVNITPQYAYDNSVNLIINDGKNPPRLINSRFSATERNQYQVCNRKGNNDSNIYDEGIQFDIDTSLYKKINNIPKLEFLGTDYGGNLPIGGYHFYFKYIDDDGNESDFFAESGLVQIFIGNSANSIHSGFRQENSHKCVKFLLSNTDASYQEVVVYYTRSTSDILENRTTNAYRIFQKYKLNYNANTIITINGYEVTDDVPIEEINAVYQIYGSAETQAAAQNMLFLANVDKPKIPYEDLEDCALRILPVLDTSEEYNLSRIGRNYIGNISNTYYDPLYIYNKVGYWDDEIYRLGVVFIKSDNTLTEVFNIRGGMLDKNTSANSYTEFDFIKDDQRVYVNYDNHQYNIIDSNGSVNIENAKGVIHIDHSDFNSVIGLNFIIPKEVLTYLQETLNMKGFFFVRQRRIPTTLCQAYTIGIDKQSHTPVLPVNKNDEVRFITESFLSQGNGKTSTNKDKKPKDIQLLTHDFESRLYTLENQQVRIQGAICPEYDVNYPYFNTLFTGAEFVCRNCGTPNVLENDSIHFYPKDKPFEKLNDYSKIKVIGLEDDTKLVSINDSLFSARAGEAEEAFRFEYIGKKTVHNNATNLLRGSYGPYLGITGYEHAGHLIDIKIPGYNKSYMKDYFSIRYNDTFPFYAISDRFEFATIDLEWGEGFDRNGRTTRFPNEVEYYKLENPVYRGDCYICQFTHRLNRNFQDPAAPTNDEIVDEKCWNDNFKVEDSVIKIENFNEINLGDVNAVQLGMYVTIPIRSSINLNIRSLDNSWPGEKALFGNARGFYPYYPMANKGTYKIPEALCYNKGFEKSVSEKIYMEVDDVPWIKNEFSSRIAYSNIQAKDAFQNGWRTFKGGHFRDYSKEYGSITKLVEWKGYLVVVCEHAILLVTVNERAVAAEGQAGYAYITSNKVLPESPTVISGGSDIGSQWRDSIIKTENYIYGVDTVAKKIWRTNGSSVEFISDNRIQEFLNNNITLTERELTPIIGIRNVKAHYNAFKNDVMFTFYDNLYGFSERVWNICYSEALQKWITFYSWVPSYSENIYKSYFSFDRNTSKWIAKLGVSKEGNAFSDGVVLSNNIIKEKATPNESGKVYVGTLSLANRTLPTGTNVTNEIVYTLERDNYLNYQNFEILQRKDSGDIYPVEFPIKADDEEDSAYEERRNKWIEDKKEWGKQYALYIKPGVSYESLCSELYVRQYKKYKRNDDGKYAVDEKGNNIVEESMDYIYPDSGNYNLNLSIQKNEKGKRITLPHTDIEGVEHKAVRPDKIVLLLNIRASITTEHNGVNVALQDAYQGSANIDRVDAGYYQSVVAVIPEYNKQFLSTDFWRHGQAGIIDIADKIYPTYWYGKQHPFEIEFIICENPDTHKIFDNLQILSNKAAPESFHYEIVGESYDFAKDKKNMYIRQEAVKELYQYNGVDIEFNKDYKDLDNLPRDLKTGKVTKSISGYYDKSTIFPQWFYRKDTINEIEDSYHLQEENTKHFDQLAGAEIVRYENLDEYRIWNHAKATDMKDSGRIRGNMTYEEDVWKVQINPLNIVQKNELGEEWQKKFPLPNSTTPNLLVPAELNHFNVCDGLLNKKNCPNKMDILNIPDDWERNIVKWGDYEKLNKETKMRDKFIKIRIRYSGEDLAIISAIKTIYRISNQ